MSSHGRYDDRRRDSGSGRHESSRRDSRRPSPPRRDRSPPPKPRNENELPEQFGRGLEDVPEDDNNVLQKMKNSFNTSPLGELYKCIDGSRKIKVWTRNFKEVRGICTGYVLAFDKHWNLIMVDVDEVYLKPRKAKTPYLLPVESDGSALPILQPKVPKKKKNAAAAAEAEKKKATTEDSDDIEIIEIKDEPGEKDPAPKEKPAAEAAEKAVGEAAEKAAGEAAEKAAGEAAEKAAGEAAEKAAGEPAGKEKKKRKRKKRNKEPTTGRRNVSQLFVRGDNIVMISVLDKDKDGA